jgi:HK97 family phage prohead protease
MQRKGTAFFQTKDRFMSQPLQVKDVDTTGRHVVFYAAAFGNVDSYGDIIMPGAFKKTIAERGPAGSDQLKYLNQHDPWQLVGKVTEAYEDGEGLVLTAKVANTTLGNDVLELEKEGAYEHSIGYKTIQSASETRNGEPVEILTELMLWEGSAVTWGANPNTPTVGIKAISPLAECDRLFKSMDRFDRLLRKGSISDEMGQQLELLHKQTKQALSDLLAASLEPVGAGEGVHSASVEAEHKHSALELFFNSIANN